MRSRRSAHRGTTSTSADFWLACAAAATTGAAATEKIIAVPIIGDLCPPYLPGCANTWTSVGATVGDPCTIACATNADATRWCPTTADPSGNDGTPWGWCAKSAEEGEAKSKEFDNAEDDWTIAGSIIGIGLIYVAGGTYYNHKTKGVIAFPHLDFWKNVGGLVRDGVTFSRAKYAGEEFTPAGGQGYGSVGAVGSSPYHEKAETVANIEEAYDEYAGEDEEDGFRCAFSSFQNRALWTVLAHLRVVGGSVLCFEWILGLIFDRIWRRRSAAKEEEALLSPRTKEKKKKKKKKKVKKKSDEDGDDDGDAKE